MNNGNFNTVLCLKYLDYGPYYKNVLKCVFLQKCTSTVLQMYSSTAMQFYLERKNLCLFVYVYVGSMICT